MPRAEQFKVLLMWHVIGPLLTRWKGYLAWSKLQMGEDLPLGVYRDWKRWCKFPRYFFDDPGMPHVAGLFGRVRTPSSRPMRPMTFGRHPRHAMPLWPPTATPP